MRIDKVKLQRAMARAGVGTSKELAKLAGVCVNTLARLNNGGSVTLPTLQKLAAALGVDPEELI